MTAYGAQVYKKGELVKEHLVTGDNGAAVLKISISELIL